MALLVFKIQQLYYRKSGETGSVDYRYWKNRGWLEAGCRYYVKTKSSILKIFPARALGFLIAKVVLK